MTIMRMKRGSQNESIGGDTITTRKLKQGH
jgi:hypothetical protein